MVTDAPEKGKGAGEKRKGKEEGIPPWGRRECDCGNHHPLFPFVAPDPPYSPLWSYSPQGCVQGHLGHHTTDTMDTTETTSQILWGIRWGNIENRRKGVDVEVPYSPAHPPVSHFPLLPSPPPLPPPPGPLGNAGPLWPEGNRARKELSTPLWPYSPLVGPGGPASPG